MQWVVKKRSAALFAKCTWLSYIFIVAEIVVLLYLEWEPWQSNVEQFARSCSCWDPFALSASLERLGKQRIVESGGNLLALIFIFGWYLWLLWIRRLFARAFFLYNCTRSVFKSGWYLWIRLIFARVHFYPRLKHHDVRPSFTGRPSIG